MKIDIEKLKRELYEMDALRKKDDVQCDTAGRIEPQYFDGDLSELGLSPKVAEAMRKELGDKKLYQHQADAIRASMRGDNVVLESPTASGKTLSFTAPMLESVCGGGTALMVYPMKAVAQDQEQQLRICDLLGIKYSPFHGGMSQPERRNIWEKHPDNQILFTTPETLHNNFLWWSKNHLEFLNRLSFLVLDEAHEYRGYFGNHMALIVRRFLAKVNKMGARPKIFVATATCANPLQHADALTGRRFRHISAGNVLRPRRHFMFINHHIPDFDFKKIFNLRIVNAAMACLRLQYSVLVFCPSISFAEHAGRSARNAAEKAALNPDNIAVFHSGLPSAEKNRVLREMQNDSLQVVFCTNALELGIDVKGLDGVILAGFPDNIAAAKQRIGRAGRSWKSDAFVLYYPMNNPLDKFVAADVQAFFRRDLDPVVVDPENDEAIEKHASCAKRELELAPGAVNHSAQEFLGGKFYEKAAVSGGFAKQSYQWILNNMRGGMYSYKLNLASGSGREVGSISGTGQFREAYIGAIIVRNGEIYNVQDVCHDGRIVCLVPAQNPKARTQPDIDTKIDIGESDILKESDCFWGAVHLRAINIGMRMRGYRLVDAHTDGAGDFFDNSKEQYQRKIYHNNHHAFIMNFSADADEIAVRSLEHIMRVGALFVISADRNDISTWSNPSVKTLYLYENYPGGIGVARQIFDQWMQIMKVGIDIAEKCQECKQRKTPKGCAACILPPFNTGDMDKREGVKLARSILKLENSDADD